MIAKITEIIEHNKWTARVIALVYDGNIPSEHVLLKNKFTKSKTPGRTKFGKVNEFVYESQYYKDTKNKDALLS